jgi:hypothetical protein
MLRPSKGGAPLQEIHAFDVAQTVTLATTPHEVVAATAAFLGVVRDLFRHPDRTVA